MSFRRFLVITSFLMWSEGLNLSIHFWEGYLIYFNINVSPHKQTIVLIWLGITWIYHSLNNRFPLTLQRLRLLEAGNKVFWCHTKCIIKFSVQIIHYKTRAISIVWTSGRATIEALGLLNMINISTSFLY